MTTIRDALRSAKAAFSASSSAGLDAQLLLAHILSVSRAHVLAHPEKTLTPEQLTAYQALTRRRAQGEPVAYILGRRAFYDREFLVTPDVLIPRPETEHLLEEALAFAGARTALAAVDVGTGSGALAVTLAANAPHARVYAADISRAALGVAQKNAALNGVSVTFFQGDLLAPLVERGLKVNLVMANLPYIASDVLPTLEVSRYEPRLALDGGPDGLDLVRRLLRQIPGVCLPGALILLEIGADQGAAASEAAQTILGEHAAILKDYAGHDRVVKIAFEPAHG